MVRITAPETNLWPIRTHDQYTSQINFIDPFTSTFRTYSLEVRIYLE
jgi:hypothetical protein